MKRIYTEIRIHHKSEEEKEQFELQLDENAKAAGFNSRAEYIRVIVINSNIRVATQRQRNGGIAMNGKYAIVCGDYTSAEYDDLKEAMKYVDSHLDDIRDEGGRDFPVQITDNDGDVVAERGYISPTDLSDWEYV
jgi:hypothetical protein